MKDKKILLISPEPWGINFVSKHHYANYLAKENTIYFLNPANGFSKNPLGNVSCKLKTIKKGLITIDYVNLIPRLNNLPKAVQKRTYKKQAKQIQKAIGIEKIDIVWSFDPNRFFEQGVWNAITKLYHTVDFHPQAKYEKDLVLSSDHFFGVTRLILDEHKDYRKGIEIVHAADLDGFQEGISVNIPGNQTIKAIYTGNFHKHIDYNLLMTLVDQNPTVDFILVGPTQSSNLSSKNTIEIETFKQLKDKPNIFFTGNVPSNHLISYLNGCDINLVLFRKENEIIHCSPHKLMAYFYSGNITLSNYIDAHKNTSSDIICMEETGAEILLKFKQISTDLARWNSAELKIKRSEFAIANSYSEKIKQISNLLYFVNNETAI